MQIKNVGLGTLYLVISCISLLLFIALTFSHILIPLVPVIVWILVRYTTKTKRMLIKTLPTPINALAEGWVKIVGTVCALKTFETPYFKQECIAYSYRQADISYDSEDNFERENTVVIEEEFQDFYLTDATGKIKVIVNKLNLALLPGKTDTKHSIKYAVDDVRYTERILKNGDVISILGYAVKNRNYDYELIEQGKRKFVIATPDQEVETIKFFRKFNYLLPYFILMYLTVNYFLFFAPVKPNTEKNEALIYFSIFGLPILGLALGAIGTRFSGFTKKFISGIGGVCLIASLLTFPLVCLLAMTNTNYYIIERVWASIFICTSLAFIVNFKKIEAFEND